jgi:putative redox protein
MDMNIVFPGGKKVDALFKGRTVRTDQDGPDPSPFELFLASLGTCAGIFVLSFFQQRELSTDGLAMKVSFHRNPESHLVELVKMEITLPPGFPEKYQTAVIKAAELCTVKQHLHQPPKIEIGIKQG